MILDLRFNGRINEKFIRRFNHIAYDIRYEFQELIKDISVGHENNIDWWVSGPVSRNTYSSPLFHYCCCLVLLKDVFDSKYRITKILADSSAFSKIVDVYLLKNNSSALNILFSVKQFKVKEFLKIAYYGITEPLKYFFINILCKLLFRPPKIRENQNIILIDTFILPKFMEADRYYPGLMEKIPDNQRNNIFFVPTWYGIKLKEMVRILKHMSQGKRKYLLKEHLLKTRDYLYAWGYIFRALCLSRQTSSAFFQGINVSALIKDELTHLKGFSTSFQALLNYRFTKRLKEKGIAVRMAVNWFENQEIDKGWNAGFRRHMPETHCIGYQGCIVTPHYLCMYPTSLEKRYGILPHKVCVMGKSLKETVKTFCQDIEVTTSPAFRFQHLWKDRTYQSHSDYFTILISLHIAMDVAGALLKTISGILGELDESVRIWVKPHPTASTAKIMKNFKQPWPERFCFVHGNFNDLVEQSDLLISTASSTCMEALAKDTPVIIAGSQIGLTHNPIPLSIPQDLWRLCYNKEELLDALGCFRSRSPEKVKNHEIIGKKIREDYFEPVTEESVRRFLGLD